VHLSGVPITLKHARKLPQAQLAVSTLTVLAAMAATVVVVITSSLYHCYGWTMVGTAVSPLARRVVRECGEGIW